MTEISSLKSLVSNLWVVLTLSTRVPQPVPGVESFYFQIFVSSQSLKKTRDFHWVKFPKTRRENENVRNLETNVTR